MIKCLLPLLTLVPTLAFADIGDTLQSSRAKYGDPVTGSENPHELVYNHNGCRIAQTYNDDGVCAVAQFCRLDGKQFSKTVRTHLDASNLPAITLNEQGNGWLHIKWNDISNMRNTTSYTWENGNITCQVLDGQMRYGDAPQWYWVRSYITPEGFGIIKADNAARAASAAQPVNQSDPTKTNI
jgi:hypothetical protein